MDENEQVDKVSERQHEDGRAVDDDKDSSVDNADQTDSAGYKRRTLRAKPRIASALDTSRLNKHLTNIWSSKRKKVTKRYTSSVPLDSPQDQLMASEVELSGDNSASVPAAESRLLSSQASTVIIVKTLPQQETDSCHPPAKLSEDREKCDAPKGSRDIAERLKARKQRLMASPVHSSMNDSGQITCELCGETVVDYIQLVRHVSQRHEDCTYVRNYLDEIQQIADALPAVSVSCEACARTFAGQAALAAHRHECAALSKAGRVSKLGAQRRRLTANLSSASDHSRQNEARSSTTKARRKAVPVKERHECEHCERRFGSQDNLARHVVQVHSRRDLKRTPATGRHRRTAVSKSLPSAGTKPANSTVSLLSAGSQYQRCDHCSALFSRTSLLVTHMRYCLKADDNR